MPAGKSLTFLLFGEDVTAGKAFKKLGVDAEAAGTRVKGAFTGGSMLAAGGLIAGLAIASEKATKFQSDMLLVQTQAGASAAEVKTMTGALLGLAPAVATGPDDLATSLYHVESVGLRGAKALDVVRIAAEGARVGHADLEQTTNALTATIASGIPGIQNMSQAMGVLNAIVGAGDMKMQDLNEALGSGVLTVVKGYGLSITDVGAALATFGDNNIRGADAATMLRMAVQAMAVPAAKGKKTLEELGLTTTQLGKDMQTGGLNKAVLDLKDHLDAAGVKGNEVGQILTEAFGKKAGPGVSVLIGQVSRLESKYADLHKGGASFSSDWDAWLKSNQGQTDQLRAHVQTLEIEVGQKMLPILNTSIGFVNRNMNAILGVGGAIIGLKVALAAWKLGQEAVNAATAIASGAMKLFGGTASATAVQVSTAAVEETAATEAAATKQTSLLAWTGESYVGLGAAAETSAATQVAANDSAAASTGRLKMSAGGAVMGIAALGLVVYEAGKKISDYTERNNAAAKTLDGLSGQTTDLTTALVNNGGVLDDNVKSIVQAEIAHTGLSDKAAKAGITTAQLTQAVTGSKDALGQLIQQWRASGKPSQDTIGSLEMQWFAYHKASQGAADAAANTHYFASELSRIPRNIHTSVSVSANAGNAFSVIRQVVDYANNQTAVIHVTATNPITGGTMGGRQVVEGGRASGGYITKAGVYHINEQGSENVYLPKGAQVQNASQTRRAGGGGDSYTINIQGADLSNLDALGRTVVRAIGQVTRNGTPLMVAGRQV